MLLSNARQRSDSGSVFYKKKFGLSSSGCFVLTCLDEKICVSVLVIERYYYTGKLCAFLPVVKQVISLYGLLRQELISFEDYLVDTCPSLCDFSESCTWIFSLLCKDTERKTIHTSFINS